VFWSNNQFPHLYRTFLARMLDIPENKIRVTVKDIGGGFGVKGHFYREDVIACLLAMKLGRPVKWSEDRIEHLQGSAHEREQIHDLEVAAKKDGTILAVKDRCIADIGAYGLPPWSGAPLTLFTNVLLPGAYRFRDYYGEHLSVVTNKCPYGAVRGPTMLQSNFVMERAIDLVARRLGLDPVTVRTKNLVSSNELPYTSATGMVYNSGSFRESVERLLEFVDYKQLREQQDEARKQGKYIGIGISALIQPSSFGSPVNAAFGIGGFDSATVRIDPSAKATVYTGLMPHGQGHETTLAQLVASELQVALEDVEVVYGDTAQTPYGIGTHSDRGAVIGGGAAILATRKVREKALSIAAKLLECQPSDLDYAAGRFARRETPAKAVSLAEVATVAYTTPHKVGVEPGLEATAYFEPQAALTWSNGAHAAVVQVDPETGYVKVSRYAVVLDCGNMINPMIVEGQVRGGVAMGLGGTLLEDSSYDSQGQLRAVDFMDYLMPTALDVPPITIDHIITPAPDNPGGFKGMGEGGNIASPAAIASAIEDALQPFGVKVTEIPLPPEKVLNLIKGTRQV